MLLCYCVLLCVLEEGLLEKEVVKVIASKSHEICRHSVFTGCHDCQLEHTRVGRCIQSIIGMLNAKTAMHAHVQQFYVFTCSLACFHHLDSALHSTGCPKKRTF